MPAGRKSPYTILSNLLARIWWALPLNRDQKEKVKTLVFRNFSWMFLDTQMYRNWKSGRFLSVIELDEETGPPPGDDRFLMKDLYKQTGPATGAFTSLAVVVHVFYEDILEELLAEMGKWTYARIKFYVTSPAGLSVTVQSRFQEQNLDFVHLEVENRGRDILPFLQVMPLVILDGFPVVLKVHTKKSQHLKTGFLWRNDLYRKLLDKKSMQSIIHLLEQNPEIGIVGPAGHIVPMNLFYGSNAGTLKSMCRALGVSPNSLFNMNFVAGSMFYARAQVFIPLLNLDLKPEDFEPETGQLDGTLAHAIERVFAISAYAAGLKVVGTDYHAGKPKSSPVVSYQFIRSH